MKCTTREAAVQRYGAIDLSAKRWPDEDKWLKMFEVPKGFLNWMVLDTKVPVTHFLLNVDAHDAMSKALNAVLAIQRGEFLLTFDGCFNIRAVRATNASVSAHSYGLAIDINADINPMGRDDGQLASHPEVVKCFTDQGWSWGGHWTHRKDQMHFSFCWE